MALAHRVAVTAKQPLERRSAREMNRDDLGRLVACVRSILPASPQGRADLVKMALADLPVRVQDLLIDRIAFDGPSGPVATGIVIALRDAGRPEKGREALGY